MNGRIWIAAPRTAHRACVVVGFLFVLVVLSVILTGCGGATEEKPSGDRPENGGTVPSKAKKEEKSALEKMSVREMVGQMFVVGMSGTEPDYYIKKMVRERNIGGVLLFGYNMESEAQVAKLTDFLQKLSLKTEPEIPLFIAVDQEGGEVSNAPWVTAQPPAAEVGGRGDPGESRAVAERMGSELLRAGVNTNFAPVVDTGFGAAIGARSYGEDPQLVAEMGSAAIQGYEAVGIVSSAKHFPNHGAATTDSHENLPVVEHDPETIRTHDLPPFRASIEAGVPMVMVGHLVYPAIDPERPASLSPEAMRMLREELGFDGVIVTDDLAMEGANGGEPPARAAVEAIKAGADLLIISSPPEQQAAAYDAVVAAVESGEISEKQIRASMERLLEVKETYRLEGPGPR